MGTRCVIARENQDGTIDGVYCALDGYPEGVGMTLAKHYGSDETVGKLMELKVLNSLGASPDNPLSYWDCHLGTGTGEPDSFIEERCVTFPDRPDLWTNLQCGNTSEMDAMLPTSGLRHAYLWSRGTWTHMSSPSWAPRRLIDVLAREREAA